MVAISFVLTLGAAPSTAIVTEAPAVTGAASITVVAAGDVACAGCRQHATADEVRRLDPTAVLTLGDNAYPDGTLWQFERFYDPSWGGFKWRTYPSPGNHEYNVVGAPGYFDYFGARAHRPGYYTFTLGSWRLISLNSNIARGDTSTQTSWLRRVLRNNTAECILAYWHHPLRSSGIEHGNDASVRPFWKALYRARADVVLNGHEHQYERFAQMTPFGALSRSGIRGFVVGTGGADLYAFAAPETGSRVRLMRYGVLRLTLASDSYSWSFRTPSDDALDRGSTSCHE